MRGEMERKTIRLEEAVPRELEISKKKHINSIYFSEFFVQVASSPRPPVALRL